MATPPFSLPSVAPQLPQVSTIACPRIYAAATNAVGQIASGEAADNATPPPHPLLSARNCVVNGDCICYPAHQPTCTLRGVLS